MVLDLFALSLWLLIGILALLRLCLVYRFRMKLIDQVYYACIKDIRKGKAYNRYRWERLDEVSFDEMVLKFWKRLDSFYPDKSFLE